MKEPTIHFFNQCLLRTPLFPVSKLTDTKELDLIINNAYFKEAIYLASKSLYEDVYIKGIVDEKTRRGLLRYYVRACTRCTPYGSFAGCTCVDMGVHSNIQMDKTDTFATYTRVDMDTLCRIADTVERDQKFRKKLLYHTNTSLYQIADRLRYIEYDKQKGRRHYVFSEIRNNEYIVNLLDYLYKTQRSFSDIVGCLISSEITEDEASDFVNDLIDNQILISNLEVSIAGDDLLHQMLDTLKETEIAPLLSELNQAVKRCDSVPLGEKIKYYETVSELVQKMVSQNTTALFHSDCKIQTIQGSVGDDVQKAFVKGVKLLNRISTWNRNSTLDSFKDAFYKKYEEQEVPLAIALDPQVGIPIGKWNNQYGDENPLIDDIFIGAQKNENSFTMSPFDKLLIKKYEEFISNNLPVIQLTEKDLAGLPEVELPSSLKQINSVVQVLQTGTDSDEAVIFMDGAVIGNAAVLLSRFEYVDPSARQLVDTITKQQQNDSDKIYAEVLHLPEDRIGNIQMHPVNREYGIAYFSNPFDRTQQQKILSINDIMVSVPYGERIKLRSKELDKEIIPVLSTAHNYSHGLPIYLFLCSIIQQESRYLQFRWNSYFSEKEFLPQVRFENIILSPAKWTATLSELQDIKLKDMRQEDFEKVLEWKQNKKIPDQILIAEGDNKLYIDFGNPDLIRVFLSLLKRNGVLLLEEFLFSQHPNNLVQRESDWFTNELIMCAYYDKN